MLLAISGTTHVLITFSFSQLLLVSAATCTTQAESTSVSSWSFPLLVITDTSWSSILPARFCWSLCTHIGLCVSLIFSFLSVTAKSLSGAQLCISQNVYSIWQTSSSLPNIRFGSYKWPLLLVDSTREVQDSAVLNYFSCKYWRRHVVIVPPAKVNGITAHSSAMSILVFVQLLNLPPWYWWRLCPVITVDLIGVTLHYWCHILDIVIAWVVRLHKIIMLLLESWASINPKPEPVLTAGLTWGNGEASAQAIKEVQSDPKSELDLLALVFLIKNSYATAVFVVLYCYCVFCFYTELNKNRRKLFEPPIRSSFLEGGASGRLSRQFHADMASVSGRW